MTLEADDALNETGASTTRAEPDTYLAGASETAAIMRAFDWAASPLGPVAGWPQGLKTAVRIMLTSRYAMWMGWGDELTFLYNDAYARMTLGAKHPWAFGKPASVVWAEIWSVIGPRIDQVIESGEATWDEALMLFLERSGYPEETYHTFSYSPLADDTGKIAGMLCVVTEETERVIGERRLSALRELGVALASAGTQDEVFSAVQTCVEERPRDLPFVLTYLLGPDDGAAARLVMSAGVPEGHPIATPLLLLADPASPWPVETAALGPADPVVVENLDLRFADIPRGQWEKAPTRAIVVPLAQQGQAHAAGFLVAGLNPYREFDDEYRGFIVLLASQVAASLANARAYEEERKRAEALAELDRAKTAFFSNISHEFRTPLTLMLGPMEDALAERDPPLPPEQRERLETAYRNTVRLLKLANNLLDFTRIEAGRVQASFQPTDLATVTADLASAFRSAMERAGLQYEVSCPPLTEPVYVDHDMWEKIVLNLLSNAFKYTLQGAVAVSLGAADGNAVLTVRDTGTGIPEKDLTRVFERFHRVEGARGRTHEGTGIGLALVQELVRLHGGDVHAESDYGKGTTFTVEIPFGIAHLPADRIGNQAGMLASTALSAESYAREALRLLPDGTADVEASGDHGTASATKARSRPAVSAARLVVADDNADMRAYITRLLSDLYEVETVTNGREALNAVLRRRPDLVVSDVMMPEMDGMELLAALRARPETATIPIVLLSARAGDDARVEGLHAGADDYLVKPFSKRELLARVATLLQLSRLRSEAAETAERFRAAFESATAGLAVSDLDGRFVEANAAFCDMVGYDLEELLSLNRLALTHPDDRAATERHIAELAAGAIPNTVAEKRYVHKNGRDVWVQSSVTAVRNGRGEPHRLLSLSHDITDRVQMRRERESVIESLQRERARLTEQQERQAVTLRYLRAVTLASKRLMQAESEEQIAAIVASTMGNDFSARICGVWLSRANNRRLVLAANAGLTAAPSRSLEPEIDVSLNAYIVGWAARFNRPFVSRTIDNKLLFDGPWLEANRITSVVILPLSFQDRVLGVLAAFFDSDLPLEASEVLSTLASVAAASLHSRRDASPAVLEAAK